MFPPPGTASACKNELTDYLHIPPHLMHLITRPLTHHLVGLSMSNRSGIGGFVMFEFAGVLYRQDFYVPINLSGPDLKTAYSDELMKAIRVIWHRVQRVIESLTMTRFDHDL